MNVSHSAGAEEKPQKQMDHISEQGHVSDFHYGLVRETIALKDAMNIPDAKTAVDKEWAKLKTLPGWPSKVSNRSEK